MIFLIIAVLLAGIAVAVASKKGRNQIIWFIVTFLFGGIPLLILAFLPNLVLQAQQQEIDSTKACPQCAERVKGEAKVCRFCSFEFPEDISVTKSSSDEKPLIEDQYDGTFRVAGETYHGREAAEAAASAISKD